MTNAADRASFGVLTQTFAADLVDLVTTQGGALQQRRRELPARLTLYLVLALWLWRNLSYKEIWRRLADGCAFSGGDQHLAVPASDAPEASSVTRARARLGTEPLALLFARTAGPLAPADTPGAFWRGYRLTAVDGTCLDVPDTAANRAAFSGPTDRTFPQIRLVAHCEIGTRCLIDASFDAYNTSEKALCEALAPSFAPDMLTVFDAGFCGTDLYRTITATGAHVIMRAGAQFDLVPVQVLADGSYTAHLKKGGPLVRVIEYTVYTDTGRTETTGETITLVTSLLDPGRYPIADFPGLYASRWEAEILYDAVKTELRGGATVRFRSQTPDLVRQEAWALLLAYQAVSDLITRAAGYARLDPDRVSFTTALNTARRSVNQTGRRFSP
ncbi:IS4 family transposase [Nocardiopsis kunsanensis]|uniref:IS4 family transposase n=1 Tax=Nocardiopsis kunsanensis TaxID=141693 RepID=UPI001EF9F38C|nr:IS4 family transposase [Nocardiopsis kunsanensis]